MMNIGKLALNQNIGQINFNQIIKYKRKNRSDKILTI